MVKEAKEELNRGIIEEEMKDLREEETIGLKIEGITELREEEMIENPEEKITVKDLLTKKALLDVKEREDLLFPELVKQMLFR